MSDVWTDDELDEALRVLHDDEPPMSEESFRGGRARLLGAAVVGPQATTAVTRPSEPWLRRHVPALVAAVVLLVVGVGAVAVPIAYRAGRPTPAVPGRSTTAPPPTPSATAPTSLPPSQPMSDTDTPLLPAQTGLDDLAGRCADPSYPAGQFLFVEHRLWGGSTGYDDVFQLWIPRDQQDEWMLRTHQGEGDPTPAEERRAPYAAFLPEGSSDGPWGSPTPQFYAERPRDPRALYDELTADPTAGSDPGAAVYRIRWITTLPPPADLRAALLRALTYHPSVTFRAGGRTFDGRPAVAVGLDYPASGGRMELLFDPDDCQILGSQNAGVIVTVRHAIVNEIGQRP